MQRAVKRIINKIWLLLACFIIIFSVCLTLLRAMTPWLMKHKEEIAVWLSDNLHQDVSFNNLKASWYGLEPILTFDNLKISGRANPEEKINIKHFTIGLDIWRSLLHRSILPGLLQINDLDIDINMDTANMIRVNGIAVPLEYSQQNSNTLIKLLDEIHYFEMSDVKLNITKNDYRLPIKLAFSTLNKKNGTYHLTALLATQKKNSSHAEIIAKFTGDLDDIKNSEGSVYLQFTPLIIQQIQSFLPALPIEIMNGNLAGKIWLTWEELKITTVQAKLQGENVKGIARIKGPKPFVMNKVSVETNWQRLDNGWQWQFTPQILILNNKPVENSQLVLEHQLKDNQPLYRLYADKIHVTTLMYYASKMLQDNKIFNEIKNMRPRGELEHLYLNYEPAPANNYSFAADFNHFGIQKTGSWPALRNMNGHVNFTPAAGSIKMNSEKFSILIPQVFQNPLHFKTVKFTSSWVKQNESWQVKVNNFHLDNEDVDLNTQAVASIPKDYKDTQIDLLTQMKHMNMAQVKNYLPEKMMSPKLYDWFNQAFVSGNAKSTIVLKGKLKDFPFDNHKGTFLAKTKIKNSVFQFAKDWPQLTSLNAGVLYQNRSLTIKSNSGKLSNADITKVTAVIPYIGKSEEPDLQIEASAKGTLSEGKDFIMQSPLSDTVGASLQNLAFNGPMDLDLKLNIPLLHTHKTDAQGTITTKNTTLTIPDWQLEFDKVSGTLSFHNKLLSAKGLDAVFFQQPVVVRIDSLSEKQRSFLQIATGGMINVPMLLNHFHLNVPQVQGDSKYQAEFRAYDDGVDSLEVNSDLQGTSADFPLFFAKDKNSARAFSMKMFIRKETPLQMIVHYGENISAAIELSRNQSDFKFTKGNLHLGKGTAEIPKKTGLLIDGSLDKFRWQDWQPYLSNQNKPKSTHPPSIDKVDMQVRDFIYGDQHFPRMHVIAYPSPKSSNTWDVDFDSSSLAGHIAYNSSRNAISTHLERLFVRPSKTDDPIQPELLPNTDIHIKDFRYGTRTFGDVIFQSHPLKDGISIEHVAFDNGLMALTGTGQWLRQNNHDTTVMHGTLKTDDLAMLIREGGYDPFIGSTAVNMNYDLHWNGAPYEIKPENFSGHVTLNTGRGVINNIGNRAIGALDFGRLFTLLSLESLPRRLILNFGDLTNKGFAFENLKSNYDLNQGDVTVNNIQIKGIVADVSMEGKVNLNSKLMDLNLKIIPHLTSSAPLIATIAGGPIIGAATWFANQMVAPVLDQIAVRRYHMSGNWQKPVIKSMSNFEFEKINRNVWY